MDDKRLDRIENKLDKIADAQSEMNSTLASQHVSLEDHIRRTNILESEIKPLKKRVNMVDGVLRFLGVIAILAGIYQAVK